MASTATLVPPADHVQTEGLDEGRLADPRHAGDPDPDRTPALRQQRLEQPRRILPVVGPGRFDEGNGARQCPAVAGEHGGGQIPAGLLFRVLGHAPLIAGKAGDTTGAPKSPGAGPTSQSD